MFRYFYRIRDKEKKPVSAVAIFTGTYGKKISNRFTYEYRKTRLLFEFPAISIMDFTDEELEKSDNPFAQVVPMWPGLHCWKARYRSRIQLDRKKY